jgi:hypothetical protein
MRVGRSRPRSTIATRTRRNGGVAWLAAFTISLFAVTPLLTIFHQISARHAVCEHGELVESGHHGIPPIQFDGSPREPGAADTSTAPRTGIRPESDAASHSHTHCSLGTLAKNHVTVLPCDDGVRVMCEIALSNPHRAEFAYLRTILLSAPKTSPPHAAI